jgi:hypothetical protein
MYGLDVAGEPAFTRLISPAEREGFRDLAQEHLKDYHTIEVWDGPLCVLRLRRRGQEQT